MYFLTLLILQATEFFLTITTISDVFTSTWGNPTLLFIISRMLLTDLTVRNLHHHPRPPPVGWPRVRFCTTSAYLCSKTRKYFRLRPKIFRFCTTLASLCSTPSDPRWHSTSCWRWWAPTTWTPTSGNNMACQKIFKIKTENISGITWPSAVSWPTELTSLRTHPQLLWVSSAWARGWHTSWWPPTRVIPQMDRQTMKQVNEDFFFETS